MESIPDWLAVLYFAGVCGELYYFLWQRAALELCRSMGWPDQARFNLLPPSFRVAWLFRGLKWLSLLLILLKAGWGIALAAAALPWILAAVVPVPHGWFRGRLRL